MRNGTKVIVLLVALILIFTSCSNTKKEASDSVFNGINTLADLEIKPTDFSLQGTTFQTPLPSPANTTNNNLFNQTSSNNNKTKTQVSENPKNLQTQAAAPLTLDMNLLNILPNINTRYLSYDNKYLYYIYDKQIIRQDINTQQKEKIGVSNWTFKVSNNLLVTYRYISSGEYELGYNLIGDPTTKVIYNDRNIEDYFIYGKYVYYVMGFDLLNPNSYSSTNIYIYDTETPNKAEMMKDINIYEYFVSGKYLYGNVIKPSVYGSQISYDPNLAEGFRLNMETKEVKYYGKDIHFVKPVSYMSSDKWVMYKCISKSKKYAMENSTGKTMNIPDTTYSSILNNIFIGYYSGNMQLINLDTNAKKDITIGGARYFTQDYGNYKRVPKPTLFNLGLSYCISDGNYAYTKPSEASLINPVKRFNTTYNFAAVFSIGDWVYGMRYGEDALNTYSGRVNINNPGVFQNLT